MDFQSFPKIARLSREVIVTEKIDGTNAQVLIANLEGFPVEGSVYQKDGIAVFAGSRNRWITPECDNHGFARWVADNAEELVVGLGIGRHYGEWWGSGIQRGYGLPKGEKRFSLFNTNRWGENRDIEKYPLDKPNCCYVVPVLSQGYFTTDLIQACLNGLEFYGSVAAPGFLKPEGIVIYHTAANMMFKKTILNDEKGKGE